jgi:polysaccharide biosynthesis transport protein
VLAGLCKAEDAIQAVEKVPNLDVLPCGPIPPQPSELLASKAMREQLRRWREQYDHIILDSPPVLSVTDAVLLSVEADAVVLVIRSGQTTKQALRHATEVLQQANARVMGVVLNGFDLKSPDSYYYYYYGSQYGGEYYGRPYSSQSED